jgi:hypothetical protein
MDYSIQQQLIAELEGIRVYMREINAELKSLVKIQKDSSTRESLNAIAINTKNLANATNVMGDK